MEWMFMPLKRYADFGGRSRRMEFWMYQLFLILLWIVIFVVMMVVGMGAAGLAANGGQPSAGGMVGMIAAMGMFGIVILVVWLGLLLPTLAVAVRRLHDTNRSGWWIMIAIVPYLISMALSIMAMSAQSTGLSGIAMIFSLLQLIGAIVLIVFYCLPGTSGPNQFGPDPLGGAPANLSQTFQ